VGQFEIFASCLAGAPVLNYRHEKSKANTS